MAKDSSFDVVSQVDMQEMDNAVNQITISAAATPALSWKKNALNLLPKMSTS